MGSATPYIYSDRDHTVRSELHRRTFSQSAAQIVGAFLTILIYSQGAWCAQAVSQSRKESFNINTLSQADLDKAVDSLAKLRLAIEGSRSNNIHLSTRGLSMSDYSRKEEELILRMSTGRASSAESLREQIKGRIKYLASEQREPVDESRKEEADRERRAIDKLVATGERVAMNLVAPGEFEMRFVDNNDGREKRTLATVPHAFRLAATLTTKKVWDQIIESAHHHHRRGLTAIDGRHVHRSDGQCRHERRACEGADGEQS